MIDDSRHDLLHLRAEALSWRVLDGEMIAIDLRDSGYLTANESGAQLWLALAEGATRHELAALLVETYDITRERAEMDVERFLAAASKRGLLA